MGSLVKELELRVFGVPTASGRPSIVDVQRDREELYLIVLGIVADLRISCFSFFMV